MEDNKIYQEIKKICVERQQLHGAAKKNFSMIASLWSVYTETEITPKDVGIMMAMLKFARYKGGDKNNLDNFVDATHYTAIAGNLENDEKEVSVLDY
jgi:hypothetical protein